MSKRADNALRVTHSFRLLVEMCQRDGFFASLNLFSVSEFEEAQSA